MPSTKREAGADDETTGNRKRIHLNEEQTGPKVRQYLKSVRRSQPNEIQFPLFNRLPVEIQLLVWKFWRQSSAIRHYMHLTGEGRFYAAWDMGINQYVTTTSRSAEASRDDPLDPMEFKIKFTNSITAVDTAIMPCDIASKFSRVRQNRLSPAFTWVNFDSDIFFLSNSSKLRPGALRFLFSNIGARMPKELASNHWGRRIQQLAIYNGSLGDLDRSAFAQLTNLRVVYIIIDASTSDEVEDWSLEGLYDLSLDVTPISSRPRYQGMSNPESQWNHANSMAKQLRSIFEKVQNRPAKVKVVLDVLQDRQLHLRYARHGGRRCLRYCGGTCLATASRFSDDDL